MSSGVEAIARHVRLWIGRQASLGRCQSGGIRLLAFENRGALVPRVAGDRRVNRIDLVTVAFKPVEKMAVAKYEQAGHV